MEISKLGSKKEGRYFVREERIKDDESFLIQEKVKYVKSKERTQ